MSLNTKEKYAWKKCFVKTPPPPKSFIEDGVLFFTLLVICGLSQKVKCGRYAFILN